LSAVFWNSFFSYYRKKDAKPLHNPGKSQPAVILFFLIIKKNVEIEYNYLFLLVFFIFLCHKLCKFNHREESMGYKKMKQNLGFAPEK